MRRSGAGAHQAALPAQPRWMPQASPCRKPTAGVAAISTALALYLIFERTFQISLPRGVLGDFIGF